jgi:Ca-activated chloride channel family protein
MAEQSRLELVKHAMRLLVGELDARDEIGVVAFATDARLVLPVTSVTQRGLIESAIHPLRPEGSTNAAAGLRMGYELALGALDGESVSRVVLLSDGVANTGETDQQRILESVRAHRERGIYLNTIGVGMNNHNDVLREQLADKGDGVCDYVDSEETARRAIVERFTGAFEPVASDVKIQVEFDPSQVYRWRQLGYENRAVADQDFRNDAVDAGEIGAGHQVVALYEIERAPSAATTSGAPSTAAAAGETPLATVRLRWKAPKSATTDPREPAVTEREAKVLASQALASYDAASYGYRRAVLAAQLAEFLRRSTHTEHDRYSELVAAASRIAAERDDAETRELAALIQRAADLVLAAHRERFELRSELDRVLDEYRRKQCLRAELECFDESETRALLENVQRQSAELEQALRDLIRRRLCEERG